MPISQATLLARLRPGGVQEILSQPIAQTIQSRMAGLAKEEQATGTANLKVFLDALLEELLPKLSAAIVDEMHTNALVAGKAAVGGTATPAGVVTGVADLTNGKIL